MPLCLCRCCGAQSVLLSASRCVRLHVIHFFFLSTRLHALLLPVCLTFFFHSSLYARSLLLQTKRRVIMIMAWSTVILPVFFFLRLHLSHRHSNQHAKPLSFIINHFYLFHSFVFSIPKEQRHQILFVCASSFGFSSYNFIIIARVIALKWSILNWFRVALSVRSPIGSSDAWRTWTLSSRASTLACCCRFSIRRLNWTRLIYWKYHNWKWVNVSQLFCYRSNQNRHSEKVHQEVVMWRISEHKWVRAFLSLSTDCTVNW